MTFFFKVFELYNQTTKGILTMKSIVLKICLLLLVTITANSCSCLGKYTFSTKGYTVIFDCNDENELNLNQK